jgi:biotin carboxyl carrier protein
MLTEGMRSQADSMPPSPRRRATIAAKITGRVHEIFAEEGMHVQPGQVLATLDAADARARLVSAVADRNATAAALGDLQVNLANAERERRRMEALRARELVSQQDHDQARMAVDSLRARIVLVGEQVSAADARIRIAQQDLDNCTVRAPFAGVVVSKDAQRGEMVSPVSAGGGFKANGHRDHRRYGFAGDRGGCERSVYRPGQIGTAGGGRAGRVPRLANPRQGPDRDSDRRPAEGDGEGAGGD